MSCASFEPRWEGSDRDPASSSSAANCREDPPEEEEDRLSTAAPSLCEEATTRWADIVSEGGPKLWADLVDSDDEDLKCVPVVQSKTKKRWADLVDESSSDADDVTRTPEDDSDAKTGAGDVTSTPSWKNDESPSWKVKGSSARRPWNDRGERDSRDRRWWSSESEWYRGRHSSGAASSSQAPGGWSSTWQHEDPAWQDHRSHWGGSWGGWYERPKGKGKGKSKGKGEGRADRGSAPKSQCQFIIGIEEESRFRVCRRLLGPQGQHMKDIAQGTGAKLRLRGRGSKFLEGPEQKESSDPLMLCVSAPDSPSYEEAKRLISSLLEDIYAQYRDFQQTEGCKPLSLHLNLHEGPRPGSF